MCDPQLWTDCTRNFNKRTYEHQKYYREQESCSKCTKINDIEFQSVWDILVSTPENFDVLLTGHLSIILVIDKLNAQILVL